MKKTKLFLYSFENLNIMPDTDIGNIGEGYSRDCYHWERGVGIKAGIQGICKRM